MDNQASRRRVSSAASSKADMLELQNLLQDFAGAFQGQGNNDSLNYEHLIHTGHSIRQFLLETSKSYRAQEVFRHLNGFHAILTTFENISCIIRQRQDVTQEYETLQDLIQTVFGVLTAALLEHKSNQKYFRQCRPGGGWQSLRNSFEPLIEYLKENQVEVSEAMIERIFGSLLSCATNEDVMTGLFGKFRRHFQSVPSQKSTNTGM